MSVFKAFSVSYWKNPTASKVVAKVWRGPENSKDPWEILEVEPGQVAAFPSDFDHAVKYVDEKNGLVSGKAPQLDKVDGPDMPKVEAAKVETKPEVKK